MHIWRLILAICLVVAATWPVPRADARRRIEPDFGLVLTASAQDPLAWSTRRPGGDDLREARRVAWPYGAATAWASGRQHWRQTSTSDLPHLRPRSGSTTLVALHCLLSV